MSYYLSLSLLPALSPSLSPPKIDNTDSGGEDMPNTGEEDSDNESVEGAVGGCDEEEEEDEGYDIDEEELFGEDIDLKRK